MKKSVKKTVLIIVGILVGVFALMMVASAIYLGYLFIRYGIPMGIQLFFAFLK